MIKINKNIINTPLDADYRTLYDDIQRNIILQGNWILAYDEKQFVVMHTEAEVVSILDNNIPSTHIEDFNNSVDEEREENLQGIVISVMRTLNDHFNNSGRINKHFNSLSDFIEEYLVNKKLNEPKYVLGLNSNDEYTINDVAITDEAMENAHWEIRDLPDFLEWLDPMIGEAQNREGNDYDLMTEDRKMLEQYDDKYMFSSQDTNAYMLPSDNEEEFNTLCEELLEAMK